MSRDMRIVNMSPGQLAEYDKVFKRQGEIAYRDMGVLSKIALFNSGKALITEGLRVVSGGGMTVSIPTGSILQRIPSGDILPCIAIADQTVTLDAASGSPRIDIIECQVKSVADKDDTTKAVLNSSTGIISLESIKRDVKYYLSVQKKTGTTTVTAATAGILSGTVGISSTIDLSANYLLNLADGEDGSFQEIDLRGSTPEATTRVEIINAINAAVGRTMASTGGGDTIVLTGSGTGETSFFEIKPPVSDSDADALQTVFGVSSAGVYDYIYKGVNDWIKLSEIDIDSATTVITSGLIRNLDEKSTWASDGDNVFTASPVLTPLSERTEQTIPDDDDMFPIETGDGKSLFIKWSTIRDYLYPVGTVVAQFPSAASNTESVAFPVADRPATKYGGTWTEIFTSDDAFFKVGTTDHQTRTDGLSSDQMQGFGLKGAYYNSGSTRGASAYVNTSAVSPGENIDPTYLNITGSGLIITDGTNGTPRIGSKTEPANYRMKLWKRTA